MLAKETANYPLIDIGILNSGLYAGPRASLEGTVTDVVSAQDGDVHINIKSKSGTLVTEIIPEYPLTLPISGDKIKIWGVTRYDIAHRWWELHPVIGWEKVN